MAEHGVKNGCLRVASEVGALVVVTLLAACTGEIVQNMPGSGAQDASAHEDVSAPTPDVAWSPDASPPTDASGPADSSADDVAPPVVRDARILGVTLPTELGCGEGARGEIRVENTGDTTWSVDQGYRLRAVEGNPLAASARVDVARGERVAPGASYTFGVDLEAPEQEGTYAASWRMGASGGSAFGETATATVEVTCPDPTEPPPPDLSQVVWLHHDVSGWPQTATLGQVTVEGNQVCMPYDKKDEWPQREPFGDGVVVVGNPWIFIYDRDQRRWYGATWEWLRPGQTCKARTSVAGDHIKRSPFDAASNWRPTSGEVYYFMISALARTGPISVQERSNLQRVVWP